MSLNDFTSSCCGWYTIICYLSGVWHIQICHTHQFNVKLSQLSLHYLMGFVLYRVDRFHGCRPISAYETWSILHYMYMGCHITWTVASCRDDWPCWCRPVCMFVHGPCDHYGWCVAIIHKWSSFIFSFLFSLCVYHRYRSTNMASVVYTVIVFACYLSMNRF